MKNLKSYKKLYKDDRFYREIFVDEIYKDVFDKKKDIVLDIGALAGEFSFWINGGKVYAIEPEVKYYEELISNIEEFGFNNVEPFNIAISGSDGDRKFNIRERGGSALNEVGSEIVKTLSLASFMKENNIPYIDVLKIDIENGEKEVFEAESFKEVAGKISCIIGEHLASVGGLLTKYGFNSIETSSGNLLFER